MQDATPQRARGGGGGRAACARPPPVARGRRLGGDSVNRPFRPLLRSPARLATRAPAQREREREETLRACFAKSATAAHFPICDGQTGALKESTHPCLGIVCAKPHRGAVGRRFHVDVHNVLGAGEIDPCSLGDGFGRARISPGFRGTVIWRVRACGDDTGTSDGRTPRIQNRFQA